MTQNPKPPKPKRARKGGKSLWYVGGSILGVDLLPAWILVIYLFLLALNELHLLESFTDNVPAFAVLLFAPAITYYFV